jgi:hypothetical protein
MPPITRRLLIGLSLAVAADRSCRILGTSARRYLPGVRQPATAPPEARQSARPGSRRRN